MTRPLLVLVAFALVAWPPAWRLSRHLVTLVHEGGHALAALASGRRLGAIRLHRDSSGVTTHRGQARGFGAILTAFAGYPAPALAGLLAAWAVSQGWSAAVLWLSLGALAALVLRLRNLWGWLLVLLVGAALIAALRWLDDDPQAWIAEGLAWFWLLAAPRTVLELHRHRRRRASGTTDADQLARLTRIPAIAWTGLFAVLTVGAAGAGALLLARAVTP